MRKAKRIAPGRHVAVAGAAADNSLVGTDPVIPEGEALRRAVAWLLEQPERSLDSIEAASQRFDLSPLDAAVLFRYFSPEVHIKKDIDQ